MILLWPLSGVLSPCMSARKISVDLLRLKKTGIMLDQMQYLTLSTVKPFKLITYAC